MVQKYKDKKEKVIVAVTKGLLILTIAILSLVGIGVLIMLIMLTASLFY